MLLRSDAARVADDLSRRRMHQHRQEISARATHDYLAPPTVSYFRHDYLLTYLLMYALVRVAFVVLLRCVRSFR